MNIQFIYTILIACFTGAAAAYIGSLMITRRMALFGDALSHLTIPGISIALLLNIDVSIGALVSAVIGIFVIWLFEIKSKLPMEAIAAVVITSSLGVAFLFIPEEEIETALIGDTSNISLIAVIATLLISISVIMVVKFIYSKLVLISISEDIAKSEKIDVRVFNFLYLFIIAIVVALGIRIVGGLLTAALVTIPAATSKNLTKNLNSYSFISILFGIVSAFVGVILNKFFDLPIGPFVILTNAVMFVVSLFIRRK